MLDLSHPTRGSADMLGFDSHRDSMAIRRKVGFLPGDLSLYPNLTGREIVEYFANLRGGVDPAAIDDLAGLDPLVQDELHRLILETRADGRTVFLSSHTLSEVDRVADRVGIIRGGALVEVARIADLKAKAVRRLDLEFRGDVDAERLREVEGVREVTGEGRHRSVAYEGPIEAVLEAASRLGIVNLHSRDADLEEIFLG